MNDLVFQGSNDQALTSSLLVAEKFGKRHADVIRAIDNLISQLPENESERNFALMYNQIPSGKGVRNSKFYSMTRDGFTLLAMGFTGAQAMKFKVEYINAFNKMEAKIKTGLQIPQTIAEALQLAADQAKEIEEKNKQLAAEAPKVLFANAVETSKKSCLIAELATILKQNGIETGQNRLFEWLRHNDYLCAHGERYNLPTQRSMDLQLFEIKKTSITKPDGTVLVNNTPKVTPKGQIYFVDKFLKYTNANGHPNGSRRVSD